MNREEINTLCKSSLDRLQQELAEGISDNLKRFLAAAARFRDYSWLNVWLIISQRPGASHVAGFRTWQQLSRFVKKGEKGIGIRAPMVFKAKEEKTTLADGDDSRILFRVVHVFDIAQTEGEPLPEPSRVLGEPRHYLEELKRVVSMHGISVTYHDDLTNAYGRSCGGRIELLSRLSPVEEYSVLAHELAHELLHRKDRPTKEQRELEAEAVAYVVCHHAGIEPNHVHADYIHLHGAGGVNLPESLQTIHSTACGIIEEMVGKVQKATPS